MVTSNTESLPSALKWAGGKRWLIPTLLKLWEPHSQLRLVEPFAGSLAVALGLKPSRALLNDTNLPLINFWKHLQQGLVIDLDMRNDKGLYYQHRERFNALLAQGDNDTAELASLFYYLNRSGFNGLCRFNTKGEFNVPFGRYNHINYIRDFRPYIQVLRGWEFTTRKFHHVDVQPDDFIYADPPYDTEFTTYSPGGFSWYEQEWLAEWLSYHPGPVVVSNQATDRVIRLYENLGFTIQRLEAPRSIASNGDRSKAQEMLATKNL